MSLPECVRESGNLQWHVCAEGGTDWFQPILCHASEGINLPGPSRHRQPTCIECYRLWRLGRVTDAETEKR